MFVSTGLIVHMMMYFCVAVLKNAKARRKPVLRANNLSEILILFKSVISYLTLYIGISMVFLVAYIAFRFLLRF